MMDLPAKRKSKRQRDQQIQRLTRRLQVLAPHLDHAEFLPLLRSYARITLLIERSYLAIRDESLISTETGEIRGAVDSIRKLAMTQSQLAKELGLTPATIRAMSREKRVDLAAVMADKDDDDEETLAN